MDHQGSGNPKRSWSHLGRGEDRCCPPGGPPWQQQLYRTIISSLRKKKQDIVREELRQHGLQSIHEAANDQTAVYYTDGSAESQGGKASATFVCTVNNRDATTSTTTSNVVIATTTAKVVNTTTAALRVTDFSSSTQTELAAIKMALEHAYTSNNHNILINTDSMTAIASLNKKHNENIHLTHSILRILCVRSMFSLCGENTIFTTATAIQRQGRTVNINWIPSHVGIAGNEKADILAKWGAQDPALSLDIPRTQRQLQGNTKHQAETRRKQQESTERQGGNVSARWLREVTEGTPHHPYRGESRRCEVVRSRIRLGYPFGWQLGITTPEERRRCRVCDEDDGYTLEHYLRDCQPVNTVCVQTLPNTF